MRYLLIFLLSINICLADEYLQYGFGIDKTGSQSKLIAIGYEHKAFFIFDYKVELGGFFDTSQPNGLIGFTNADIGTHIDAGFFYAKLFFGPALITQTDTRLSNIFEFNHDLEFGLKNKDGLAIGFNYKHMSNAGITPPNLGRDFLLLKLTLPY